MAAAIWAEERIIGTWSVVTVPPRRSASMRQMSGESVIGLLGERAPTICATLDFGQSWMATSRTVAATARPLETVMSESGDDFSVSRAAAYRGTMVLGSCPGLTCATRAHFNPYRLTSASSSCIRRSSGCPISMRTMPRSRDSLSSREMVGREYPICAAICACVRLSV